MIKAPSIERLYFEIQTWEETDLRYSPFLDGDERTRQIVLACLGHYLQGAADQWLNGDAGDSWWLEQSAETCYQYLRLSGHSRVEIEWALLGAREEIVDWWGDPETDDGWRLLCITQSTLGLLFHGWRESALRVFTLSSAAELILAAFAWAELLDSRS